MTIFLEFESQQGQAQGQAAGCKLTGTTLHDVQLISGWNKQPSISTIAWACGIAALKYFNEHAVSLPALGSQFLQFQEFQRIRTRDPAAFELELSGLRVYLQVSPGKCTMGTKCGVACTCYS